MNQFYASRGRFEGWDGVHTGIGVFAGEEVSEITTGDGGTSETGGSLPDDLGEMTSGHLFNS